MVPSIAEFSYARHPRIVGGDVVSDTSAGPLANSGKIRPWFRMVRFAIHTAFARHRAGRAACAVVQFATVSAVFVASRTTEPATAATPVITPFGRVDPAPVVNAVDSNWS